MKAIQTNHMLYKYENFTCDIAFSLNSKKLFLQYFWRHFQNLPRDHKILKFWSRHFVSCQTLFFQILHEWQNGCEKSFDFWRAREIYWLTYKFLVHVVKGKDWHNVSFSFLKATINLESCLWNVSSIEHITKTREWERKCFDASLTF